jgi:hypothetical protein
MWARLGCPQRRAAQAANETPTGPTGRPRELQVRLAVAKPKAVEKWLRFTKYVRFTAAVEEFIAEQRQEEVALRWEGFAAALEARSRAEALLEGTYDPETGTVPLVVLERLQQWLQ